jgi:hypothetical protein
MAILFSLKSGNEWLLTTHTLMKEPVVVEYKTDRFLNQILFCMPIMWAPYHPILPPWKLMTELPNRFFKLEADLKNKSVIVYYLQWN